MRESHSASWPGTRSFKNFVMLEPLKFEEVIEAHKDRPWAIAGYLHGVGSHEVAHLPHMGQGHNEPWAVQREDLGFATAHLLPAIEQLVIKLLKGFGVKDTLSPAHKKRVDAAVEAEAAKQRTRRVEAGAVQYLMQIRKLEAEAKSLRDEVGMVQADRDRYKNIIDSMKDGWELARRVLMAQEYHEVRAFLTSGPGASLLPPGVSVQSLLAALEKYPQVAVDVFVGSRSR